MQKISHLPLSAIYHQGTNSDTLMFIKTHTRFVTKKGGGTPTDGQVT